MKKNLFKIVVLVLTYVAISLGVYFVLKACGLTTISKIRDFISSTGAWGYVVFFLFQVVSSTFICIIPFEDELLTACAIVLFGPIKGFCIASFNMFVTSSLQFLIGRYFCKGLITRLIGGDAVEKYQNYLQVKGEIMLPILYLIPLFPHDSLCLLAGMSKMKYLYFAPITLVMRSIEIAELCFLGSGIIDFGALSVMDWILIANVIIIDIYLIFKLQKFIENKIQK
ncbi:MAG: TVP38/TMEM64 family protein [Clostridia bacterium]|nr:TVP38/TMEM64 family protein [Clostridia bacterium]